MQQQGGWGKLFLSTPSARRATGAAFLAWWGAEFLSTPSARRATQASNKSHRPKPFLSTPSARRATESGTSLDKASPISIHALREEGDPQSWFYVEDVRYFYPRPPRGGRRGIPDNHATLLYFYPRPPRGGRPQQRAAAAAMVGFLSTPSARRATRMELEAYGHNKISIHALREEGDS